MRNILRSLFIVLGCLAATLVSAQTTVTWTPTQADVTALTNTSIHYVDVGTGTKSFKVYSIRPFLNNNAVKLVWDASKNAIKMDDNGMEKAGLAIYVPTTSDNISKIVVYMHTTGTRKTYYASGNPCPTTGTATPALATTSTGYEFWTGNLSKDVYYACGGRKDGGGDSYYDKIEVTFAGKATDATLSDLKVDGTTITGFDPSIISYSYSVAATATTAPVISATKNDSKASDPVITQPTMPTAGNPTTGTVQVTAEDGTTTKTYTVTFTRAELSHDATLSDIKVDGQSISGFNPATTSYTVNIPYSQTAIPVVTATPNNTGANAVVTAASSVTGTASILVTAEDGTTTNTYTLTFQKDAPSTDATLSSLTYNGQAVSGFNPSTTSYSVALPEGSYVPSVNATTTHPFATFTVQQATSTSGTATITVTAEDGSTTKTYTIQFSETVGPPVPPTSLTLHEPEVYEAKTKEGGYGGQLSIFDGHEYEVYYAGRWDNGGTKLTMHIDPIDKSHGVTQNETNSSYEAIDGWFKGSGADKGTGFAVRDEFKKSTDRCHTISSSNSVEIHIKGYDQFALHGADKKWSDTKPADRKYFKVLIDNVEQEMTPSTDQSIRRFNITTTEHVIKIIHSGGEQSLFGGFSLRVPQAPKIKHLKGNDSTQVVLQTMPINKVVYTCKYRFVEGAATRLEWDGPAANGITLNAISGSLADTLTLSGTADCPVGTYKYIIISTLNGVETSRVTGTFVVKSDIRSMTSINAEAYQNEEMDQIIFKYYALDANDVHLTWPGGKPQGVDGYGTQQPGEYVIGGIPTTIGNYRFAITVEGADTTINGKLTVKELNYGENPVLYLYKNDLAYTKDGVYNYLHDGGTYNPISRRAKLDGLRAADQYSKYKWILISEDVDADNPEILALARGEGNLPVLNMKGFSYTKDRLNWGDPNNGSLTKAEGRYITVLRDDHPIFKALNKKQGDRIQVLDSTGNKGLMPISVNYAGTLCLATARTRDINDYNGDGPEETFLHEVPAEMHRNQKYLCLPIGQSGTNYLHADGKRLIDECIKYILSNDATIQLPDLAITRFQVGSYSVVPDDNKGEILLEVLAKDSDMLKAATPVVTLASPMTHAYPSVTNADGTVDFTNWRFGVQYIVSDYINKRSYDVVVRIKAAQGIDEIEVGEWINIYDIYGRKVATTNEDFRTMDLPRGMYILVTESGKTLKVMR